MREIKNGFAAAIIFGQENVMRMIVLVEIKEVRSIGPLETVNCLIVVADCHDVWLVVCGVVGDERDELSLSIVGVLKFIEQNVLEALLHIEAFLVVGFEQIDGF